MTQLVNLVSLILTCLWNAGVLLGVVWLILEKGWSEWSLLLCFLFFARWRTVEEKQKQQEQKRIILDEKLPKT
jgi:putative Ca2+/H+ antiporter (TMEM165/GDT1 family)